WTKLQQPHAAGLAEDAYRELLTASAANIDGAGRTASIRAEADHPARADVDGIVARREPAVACFDRRQRRDHAKPGAGKVIIEAARGRQRLVDAVLDVARAQAVGVAVRIQAEADSRAIAAGAVVRLLEADRDVGRALQRLLPRLANLHQQESRGC